VTVVAIGISHAALAVAYAIDSSFEPLTIIALYAGRSLHFAPNVPQISVDRGNNAVFQCVLGGDSTHGGFFSWTGPAVTSGRAVRTLDTSGTVSTLTIASVGRSDEGQYSCSFTGLNTISITLDVVCKLSAIALYRSIGFQAFTDSHS
jgi:hypothetical protein